MFKTIAKLEIDHHYTVLDVPFEAPPSFFVDSFFSTNQLEISFISNLIYANAFSLNCNLAKAFLMVMIMM